MKLPENYNTVMPYLILEDATGFISFSKKLYNAEELQVVLNEDKSVMHGEIRIGDSTIMIGQSGNQWKPQPAGLYIHVEDCDITYKKALDLGAESVMEPSDQKYGRAAGVNDPFGNTWWLTSELK